MFQLPAYLRQSLTLKDQAQLQLPDHARRIEHAADLGTDSPNVSVFGGSTKSVTCFLGQLGPLNRPGHPIRADLLTAGSVPRQ